ncbi:MAG TPA: hypothetical protein VHE30_16615 [Polyangiaceae bacterium]|nr:hypothetical protein [Polyangiaceae bacterium]
MSADEARSSILSVESKRARSQPIRRVLLLGFCVYHVAALCIANLPETTALGSSLHGPFSPYLSVFALRQTWDMFTTIPHFLAMRGELVSRDVDGHERRDGPLLPGLRPYGNDPRIHVTFMRLAFSGPAYPGYADRYLASVCRALAESGKARPDQVGFELDVLQLRALSDVKRDGRIAEPKTFTFGPARCAR